MQYLQVHGVDTQAREQAQTNIQVREATKKGENSLDQLFSGHSSDVGAFMFSYPKNPAVHSSSRPGLDFESFTHNEDDYSASKDDDETTGYYQDSPFIGSGRACVRLPSTRWSKPFNIDSLGTDGAVSILEDKNSRFENAAFALLHSSCVHYTLTHRECVFVFVIL